MKKTYPLEMAATKFGLAKIKIYIWKLLFSSINFCLANKHALEYILQ